MMSLIALKRSLIRLFGGLGVALLVALFIVWLKWFSPFGYSPPKNLPAIENRTHEVFVFGTLKSPILRWVVMGRMGDAEPAMLVGMRRDGLTVIQDSDSLTTGYVLSVSAEELSRLDYYERLGVRYERINMTLKDGRQVWVYRRL